MSESLIEVIKDFEQKNELWQWDTGRQIKITLKEDAIVDEVHFSNAYSKDALVVKPQVNAEGNIVADIPNILLWQVFPINVYVVMEFPNGKGTIYEEQLKINPRKKPSDYVYTETEILNYLDLEKRIKALEENGTGGGIAEETDPTVPQWAKQPTKPSYTADEVGAPGKEEFEKLSEEIEDLKENGTGSGTGLTAEVKTALLNCFKNVAWTVSNGQDYYDALENALNASGSGGEVEPDIPDEPIEPDNPEVTLVSISATYTGSDVTVGTSVNDLTGITVKAHYSDGTSKTVSGYTLSGTISEGSNTITVSYGGKTTTFTVTGYTEVVETWEEAMVLSYAKSTVPSPSNNYIPVPTTNTGYANACSTNEVEHFGGVLHVECEEGAFGFEMGIVLEDSDGTRCGLGFNTSTEKMVTSDNIVIEPIVSTNDFYFIDNRNSLLPFTVVIPVGYKIACLFFRNMSDKANIIAQNGVTFTLKGV